MNNVYFDVSSVFLTDGLNIKPDANGVYKGFPLAVIGKPSRNNKFYEVESVLDCIVNPNSVFNKKITGGQLEGEWYHPMIFKDEDLPRLMLIDRAKVSHAIHRVYTGKPDSSGYVTVYGDLEPAGPMGPYLKESLENPRRNTAFSLRSIVNKIGQQGSMVMQRMVCLVTFDATDAPGYYEASKHNVQKSAEAFTDAIQKAITVKDIETYGHELCNVMGIEGVNNQELLDKLQVNSIKICNKINGIYDADNKRIITPNGDKRSVFHSIMTNKGK